MRQGNGGDAWSRMSHGVRKTGRPQGPATEAVKTKAEGKQWQRGATTQPTTGKTMPRQGTSVPLVVCLRLPPRVRAQTGATHGQAAPAARPDRWLAIPP